MADPTATALLSGAHITAFAESDLPKAISLTGAGTPGNGASIAAWEWSLLPRDPDNAGGLPEASLLDTTTVGDFIDGKSAVQNPSVTLDVVGGYNFSLRVQNNLGDWSDPSFIGDNEQCQAIVYILTNGGLRLPPANMFHYEDSLHQTVQALEPRNLDLVQPSGVVAGIEGLWVFDGSGAALDDRTANGHDLIQVAGATEYSVCNRRVGLNGDGINRFETAAARPGLQILGALTIELLITPGFGGAITADTYLHYGGPAEPSEAENSLYSLLTTGSVEHQRWWRSFHEDGAGSANNFSPGAGEKAYAITGCTALVHYTRAANGVDINLYIDGILVWSHTAAAAPTGGAGANTRFQVFHLSATQIGYGVMHSIRITPEEYTPAQVLAVARRVVGPVGPISAGLPS